MRLSRSFRPTRHVFAVLATVLSIAGMMQAAPAADRGFPFDHELRFDANPVRGSKRVPGLQISKSGAAEIDLWCVRGKGHAVIIEDQITIVPLSMQDNQCPADRLRGARGRSRGRASASLFSLEARSRRWRCRSRAAARCERPWG